MNPYHQIRERYVQNRAGTDDIVVHRPWTEDELAEACLLRRDRWSASAIARKLKRTRNSVIGALWRAEEPRVLANHYGASFWERSEPAQGRAIPMRFSEQRRVP